MPVGSDAEKQYLLFPKKVEVKKKVYTTRSISSSICWKVLLPIGQLCVLLAVIVLTFRSRNPESSLASPLEACAWNHLEPHLSLLSVPPIRRSEFLERQKALALELDVTGVDAFIAEPSASTSYYANITSSFHLSERPFLMIIDRNGNFTTLVPKFEAGRIAKLDMVSNNKTTITWIEEESPYEALARGTGYKKVMIDEHARFMIATGLQEAGIEVVPMSETIQSLRSIKSVDEIALLKGINSFTLTLVQSLQKCIRIGMTQEEVIHASQALFMRAGVGYGFWALILFGEQAALPHGGETGRTLQEGEFVLIDIGSELHGYCSDVTRTILPAGATVSDDLMAVWQIVRRAQSAGLSLMHANEACSAVDSASRDVIQRAGYGQYYTHRLGHGLGLEGHEPPYLNGANHQKLKLGEVATNEPGIYVTTEEAALLGKRVGFGIRLEDPILVTQNGGVPLTGNRAKSPWDP
ncbi:peptidase M24, structural domain-containing protein [Trichoderma chlorosporum]